MKKELLTILFSIVTVLSYALPIECVGTATQVVDGKDTIFVFKDEIGLKSTVGPIDWYRADGSLYASAVSEIYPDEGCYSAGGMHFCVQVYKPIDDLDFTIEASCENTILHVTGLDARARMYSLSYNALAWNTEQWADSAVNLSGRLTSSILLPPLYGATDLHLCYDPEIRAALGLDSACVVKTLSADEVKAVKIQLTSLATARGAEGEKSNELNRPTSQTLVEGSEYSGPLDVMFYANATPAAQFFYWEIYNSTERIATRNNDTEILYTFSEPGKYRVVCKANNASCTSDSMEVAVAIKESYLMVPNVFTPNGDGKNDEFRVAYRSLKEFHIWVYNRWGKLVYESTDPAKGWNGMINGRPAPEGAYFYVIRALGTDVDKNAGYIMKPVYDNKKKKADESLMGVYQLSGDINLLR